MNNLTKFFKALQSEKQSLCMIVEFTKIVDWHIQIFHKDSYTTIFSENDVSLELLATKAILNLKQWADENNLENVYYNIFD